jgi:predicted acetyltransferase
MDSSERLLRSINVTPATLDDEPIVANLLELYMHDFCEILEGELGDNGRFGYKNLPLYWSEEGRHPFLIRVDGKLAGFALVKAGSEISENSAVWDMAEFFIVRGYRRQGVGSAAASEVLDRFPGRWEVRVMDVNYLAQRFWERAISDFVGKTVRPKEIEKGGQVWHVFGFESAP